MDLKLTTTVTVDNPVEGDLEMTNGDFTWLGLDGSTDADEVAQHIRVRLRFWKGEWFKNVDEGTPYFDEILEKGVDDGRVASILKKVILGTPGVASLSSYSQVLDNSSRTLNVSFVAVLDSGHVLNSADFGPFIVEL